MIKRLQKLSEQLPDNTLNFNQVFKGCKFNFSGSDRNGNLEANYKAKDGSSFYVTIKNTNVPDAPKLVSVGYYGSRDLYKDFIANMTVRGQLESSADYKSFFNKLAVALDGLVQKIHDLVDRAEYVLDTDYVVSTLKMYKKDLMASISRF